MFWLPVSLASALFLQAAAAPATHRDRPSFDGAWRLDQSRSESAANGGVTGNVEVEITQGDREVTIVTMRDGRRGQTVHPVVDNPATPYAVDGTTGRAYWNGEALITEGTRLVQGQTVATRETRTLNGDGSEMLVEVVVIVQHGYQFRGARNYGIGKDVYTRVAR